MMPEVMTVAPRGLDELILSLKLMLEDPMLAAQKAHLSLLIEETYHPDHHRECSRDKDR